MICPSRARCSLPRRNRSLSTARSYSAMAPWICSSSWSFGVIRDWMLQECHLAAGAAELFEQQDLVGVTPRQAIRAQHRDELDGAVTDRVAQGVEAGPIEAGAAVALVAEDVLLRKLVSLSPDPVPKGGELAADGLLAFL